ncbi:MAG TPA: hypothetical protein VN964_03650 [Gemmatimonadales bacterium]|nr:hypothetical protein [Gemmatimonadales bacterium]
MNRLSVLWLAALAAAPLAAQQPMPPMGHMMGDPMAMQEMMGPMMQVMLYTPQHLLARKDALGLTPDQVSRLTALRAATQTGQDAAMSEGKTHLQELEQAANAAAPDTGAMKTHFQAAQAAMGKAHWLALASAVQGRAVLTDAQRAKLKAWADSMQTWMQQHRQMMKPGESH